LASPYNHILTTVRYDVLKAMLLSINPIEIGLSQISEIYFKNLLITIISMKGELLTDGKYKQVWLDQA